MPRSEFLDLKFLFRFRELLDELGSIRAARAALAGGAGSIRSGRVGILPGSFNPPTLAHIELGMAARQRFGFDRVVFSLSSVIIDKEEVAGICQEDRLLLLSLLAQEYPWIVPAGVNCGLYYEQVQGFRELFGKNVRIYFVVGMDKVIQIFDPRYYEDRDAALKTLFFEAQLVAADRGEWGQEELDRLLARRDNQAYEGRVYPLALSASLKDLSSTAVRTAVVENRPIDDAVPRVVAEFIEETGTYRETYEVRAAALRALYPLGAWAEDRVDLGRVIARAQDAGTEAEALRARLFDIRAAPETLKQLLMRLDLCRS